MKFENSVILGYSAASLGNGINLCTPGLTPITFAGVILKAWDNNMAATRSFFCRATALVGQGLLIIEASRSHSVTHTTLGRIPLDEWSALRRDLYLTTHNTRKRQTSMPPGGIRTRNPSKRAVADPHLRPRGHWDRRAKFIGLLILLFGLDMTSCTDRQIDRQTDTHTHTHPVALPWTSDQPVADAATNTTHNKHNRRTSMRLAGF